MNTKVRSNPTLNSLLTNSATNSYLNCQKLYQLRYEEGLIPIERDSSLSFGSVFHDCLELWHRDRDLAKVLALIDSAYPNRSFDEVQKAIWHKTVAMMTVYAETYAKENFEVVALERTFEGPIVNPKSGRSSRTFRLGGKADMVVDWDVGLFLTEHKTTAQITSSYLERLWTDFQIILYSEYLSRMLKKPIHGVIYNILTKPKLQQSKGETEAEYEARKAGLIAKSKTGKTTAKRKMPESDEAFQSRLQAKLREPGMFHREVLYLSKDRFEEIRHGPVATHIVNPGRSEGVRCSFETPTIVFGTTDPAPISRFAAVEKTQLSSKICTPNELRTKSCCAAE